MSLYKIHKMFKVSSTFFLTNNSGNNIVLLKKSLQKKQQLLQRIRTNCFPLQAYKPAFLGCKILVQGLQRQLTSRCFRKSSNKCSLQRHSGKAIVSANGYFTVTRQAAVGLFLRTSPHPHTDVEDRSIKSTKRTKKSKM